MASQRIKGITIEIDGNTSKLQDALKDVDKQINSTNSGLRDINKLLKLDPSNVELLAQKHDKLTDAIRLTTERLNTLGTAFEQAEPGTEEYERLQREIIATQQKMNSLTGELDELETSSDKTDSAVDELGKTEEETGNQAQDLGRKTKDAGDKAEDGREGFENLKETVSAVAVAIGTATVAVGAFAVKIGSEIVEQYAEYEQLVGGVETLFGDSSDALMEYAEDAYKTAGLSASDYLETVTGFSASLISAMGGDTEGAVDVANQALVDMADNANKMGTDMASLQNAYSGFAKQNYNMLDNLKLGYGGTKEEMERLLADATALSGIEYDIDSLDDVYSAIHVIQEEMGISGATALEAETTISGSIGMLKGSFENLVVGLGDADADTTTLTTNMVSSFDSVVSNITPVISNIVSALPGLVGSVLSSLTSMLPELMTTAGDLMLQVGDALLQSLPVILTVGLDVAMTLIDGVIEAFPQIIDSAFLIIEALVTGLTEALPELLEKLPELVGQIGQSLIDNLPMILESGIALIEALGVGIYEALPELLEQAPDIIVGIIETLAMMLPDLADCGVTLFTALIKNLPLIITKLIEACFEIVSAIGEAIVSYGVTLVDVGGDLIESIKEGFESGSIKEWWDETLEEIGEGFTECFEGIGEHWTEFWDGLKEKIKLPHFSLSGSFSLNPLSVPKLTVDWYSKAMDEGMILNGATIFGASGNTLLGGGEAGAEAIIGVSSLRDMIRQEAGGMTVNMTINGATGQDVQTLARIVEQDLYRQVNNRRNVFA